MQRVAHSWERHEGNTGVNSNPSIDRFQKAGRKEAAVLSWVWPALTAGREAWSLDLCSLLPLSRWVQKAFLKYSLHRAAVCMKVSNRVHFPVVSCFSITRLLTDSVIITLSFIHDNSSHLLHVRPVSLDFKCIFFLTFTRKRWSYSLFALVSSPVK